MTSLAQVAQLALESAYSVTSPARRPEVAQAFRNAGIRLSEDGSQVLGIGGPRSIQLLGEELKSSLPTARIATKLVFGKHRVAS